MPEFYTVDPDKLLAVAQIVQAQSDLSGEDIRAFLLAEWREDEHQRFLDETPADELAAWVLEQRT